MELDTITYAAAVASAALSATAAAKAFKTKPRLFFALTTFATAMAFLTTFYSLTESDTLRGVPRGHEEIGGFTGVLLVLCGSFLRREVGRGNGREKVGRFETWTLGLLIFILLPHYFKMEPGHMEEAMHRRITQTCGTIITVIGTLAMIDGIRQLVDTWVSKLTMILLATWTITEIYYTASAWMQTEQGSMPDELKWAFAIHKVAFTLAFIWTLAEYTVPRERRTVRAVLERLF